MNCNSKFLIRVMTWAGCGENCIGETKSKLARENDTTETANQRQEISSSASQCTHRTVFNN